MNTTDSTALQASDPDSPAVGSDPSSPDTPGSAAQPSAVLARRGDRQVGRRLPRAQSLPVQPSGEPGIGVTELGRISVTDSVVARLAARAALEVDDVGAAAPRLLGVDLSGGGLDKLGVQSSEIGALPTASATVDGALAFVDLTVSVRYPASVRRVADAVRQQVRDRVGQLTGLDIVEVDITVPALVSEPARRPRVL